MHTQSSDYGHSLFLPAGQLTGITVCLIRQADACQKLHGFFRRILFFSLLYFYRSQRNIIQNCQMGKKIITLKNHADLLSEFLRRSASFLYFFTMQTDGSALYVLQSIDTAKQCTLSTAARSHDHDNLTLMHGEVHPIQYTVLSVFFY